MRSQTRFERYLEKKENLRNIIPISLCTISFTNDTNTGMSLRSAACFGLDEFYIIGRKPDYSVLKKTSGSLSELTRIKTFPNPASFLRFCREENKEVVSLEISDTSTDIKSFNMDRNKKYVLVVGNEYTGIPQEILFHSVHLHIPMPGIGYCLNSAIAASIGSYVLSETFRKTKEQRNAISSYALSEAQDGR